MIQKHKTTFLAVSAVCLGIVIGLILASNFNIFSSGLADEETRVQSNVEAPVSPAPIQSNLESTNRAFVEIAKRVTPAVVSITSEKVVKVRNPLSDFFQGDDLFGRFFRLPGDGQREYRQQGLGSGVIVDPQGYILTNFHVIKDADEINVLIDKNKYDAKVAGTDPASDVAVIKIEKRDLPTIPLGNSDNLEVGEWVLAIGSPFTLSLEHSVTAGIISAKGRSNLQLGGDVQYQDFIQTDAAINPGNSGGALVNLRGELIGINTAIYAGNLGGNLGIGFAIPINMAKRVKDELIAHGKVVRGYLGVLINTPDAEMSQALGVKQNTGAVVIEVVEGAPADRAGLKKYDVIVQLDGQDVEDHQHLTNMIASYKPGSTARFKIIRDGKQEYVNVKLDERPENQQSPDRFAERSVAGKLGLKVTELTDELAHRYRYEGEDGVLVVDVRSGSPADEKGIRAGDLIKEINRHKINNALEFEKRVEALDEGEIVLLQIKRASRTNLVALEVPRSEK